MARSSILVVCLLTLSSLAGCILELPADDALPVDPPAQITKKVVVTFEPERMDNEDTDFESIVKTRFEYRHEAADMAPDQVTAAFTAEGGSPSTQPLSRFTTQPTLRSGDVITITGVNLTSGLVVRNGQTVLAERANLDKSWFRAEGAPIPLRTSQPGRVEYQVDSEGKFEFEATNFEVDESTRVQFAKGRFLGKLSGTALLRTLDAAAGPRVELSSKMVPDVDALAEARVTEEGRTYDVGGRVYDDRGSFEATGVLQFDADHRLRSVAQSSKSFFDARVQIWDDEHPRSSNHEPEDMQHPLLDEQMPYEEHTWEDSESPEAWLIEFLNRVWNTGVAVGDDYRVHFDTDFGGDGPGVTFDLILQIAAAEPRTVGGQALPAYRVSQVGNLVVDPDDGAPADFELMRSTYWISSDSYLPLYAQSTHTQSINREKINSLFSLMGEEAPDDLPDTASLVFTDKVTISMKEYSGDLMIAPLIGLMSGNQGWLTGGLSAAGLFFMVSDIGGHTAMTAPAISWAPDEAQDRLIVNAASSQADWMRLTIQVSACTAFPTVGPVIYAGSTEQWWVMPNHAANTQGAPLNEESSGTSCGPASAKSVEADDSRIMAGDYIEFCAAPAGVATAKDVKVTIIDQFSNTVMMVHTFSNVAPC